MTTEQIQANRETEIKRLTAKLENARAMIESSNRLIAKFKKQELGTALLEQQKARYEKELQDTTNRLNRLQEH